MYESAENPIFTEDNYDLEGEGSDQETGDSGNDGGLPKVPTEPAKDGVKVAPKIVIRKPRVILTTAKLKGERGLHTIEDYFRDVKFKGKGHEAEDVTLIMRKLEHWGHRVFPAMLFEDFLTRLEELCRKKDVQNHLRLYKLGMLTPIVGTDDQPEERMNEDPVDAVDDFDALLSEQMEMQRNVSNKNSAQASSSSYMDYTFREDLEADSSLGVAEIPPTPPPASKMTEEAKAKIAENRRAALERLRAKQATQSAENIADISE
ncbi:protein TIPIN homolog [Phlebotomus argentipes]|uniref:protein TIPIN homolog n=1 Tax=Phlebotomus argentipes TaxID=94469 RepID=UPI002892B3FB|nr:protein TIPIN homolog [Phlebotomus argentipes]